MILDSESQRKLLLAIISDHIFSVPGKALVQVTNEVNDLANSITQAPLSKEDAGESQETS